ncbi:MAG: hypothetical protein KGO92_03200 [Bacteroidota bacterium]|nr:hypothetical protein [Bacteroidota bacterium]
MKRTKIYSTVTAFLLVISSFGQKSIEMPPVPAVRQMHHQLILNSLNSIEKLGASSGTHLAVSGNAELDQQIITILRIHINNLRAEIEKNPDFSDNDKFKWLRGVNEMLQGYITGYKSKTLNAAQLPVLVKAYEDAMQTELSRQSILPIIESNSPEVDNILLDNFALKDNPGIAKAGDYLVLKACQRNPEDILKILSRYPNNRFADSLIIQAAFRDQEELYNYAAAPTALGRRIQSVNHPLVKIIGRLALTKTGRMYFPFLDELYHNRLSIDSITPLITDESSEDYYKLLVRTRISYADRMHHGDTPMAAQVLTNKLQAKAVELYINEINALHDEPNENIRFRKLATLGPEELFYLAVMGEEEIYTSSFVVGVYPRIFQRMKEPRSDSLLGMLHNDYYKKFIKICAAYNTLDNFLSRMDKTAAENLMRSFVSGLETNATLEDAVDVADSYASIYNKEIRKLIDDQIQQNLAESKRTHNQRGELIYNLLNTIFLSMDPANKINVSARLGIDPIYTMPRKSLENASGRIIIQQFSYGDKDAKTYFSAFMSRFNNANWHILRKPQWVEISSARGTPITIYANLPLDETQELDIEAQDSLIAYLKEKGLAPMIVIHRGHSYYLQETINRLPSSAKVVLLGSCGGYQKLNDILQICPSAHIISSKQVAAGVVNQSLIDAITERLRSGKDLNWEELWHTVSSRVGAGYRDKFEDYIPPNRNLGAIFIMAYEKAWHRKNAG